MESLTTLLRELWNWEFMRFIAYGLAEALVLIMLPSSFLRWLGRKPAFHPNLITLYRLPLYWIGMLVYFNLHTFIGFMIAVGAVTLDRLDGRVAKLTGLMTEVGKWLDPLIDKLTIPPGLVYMGFEGVIWWPVTVMITVVDAIGSLIRDPFLSWLERKALEPDSKLARFKNVRSWFRSSGSTGIGKSKFSFQFTSLLCCLPYHQRWFDERQWLIEVMCWVALALGVLSLLSRVNFTGRMAWLNGVVDAATRPFHHDDD